jgi:RNA polymerase sigma factor (sigma-70 family)
MATRLNKVLEHLHRVLSPPGGELTDGQLLARFVAVRDEASFAALVRRHGRMVLGVCRRMLRHTQDAEDCFQATFLVLARKASVVRREAVGSWLYAVAYRTSLEARTVNARRRARERQVEDMPHPEVMPGESQDWRPWLDLELNRLPEKYRAVIVSCDLEGQSRKDAAHSLGLAEGTISSRLARGRRLLAKRLSRYGLSLSGGALAAALSAGAASAHASASLVLATAKAASGPVAAVAASVGILTKGVLQAMLLAKLKLAIGVVMVMAALGTTGLVYRASGQSAPAQKRPISEVEALRHENELLKLNLEVVLEKVRAQEAELRTLRADAKKAAAGNKEVDRQNSLNELLKSVVAQQEQQTQALAAKELSEVKKRQEDVVKAHQEVLRNAQKLPHKSDPLQEAEDALKALRDARDTESQRKAADKLDKALKSLRDQRTREEPDRGSQ